MKTTIIHTIKPGVLTVILCLSINTIAFAGQGFHTNVKINLDTTRSFSKPVGIDNFSLLNLEINHAANQLNQENIDISPISVFQFGDTDITQITQVVKDANGNSYITGGFTGSFTWGSATLTSSHGFDMFVAKMDANNGPLWARIAAGATDIPDYFSLDGGLSLAVNSQGNVYVAGAFVKELNFLDENGNTVETLTDGRDDDNLNFEMFVAKYSTNGDLMWADGGNSESTGALNTLAVDRNIATSIILDTDEYPYVAGAVAGQNLFGEQTTIVGDSDFFLASLDTDGSEAFWVSTTGTPDYDHAMSISVDANGFLNVLGVIGQGVMELPDSPITWNNDTGANDTFVISYDVNGDWYFASFIGGGDRAIGNDIATLDDGDFFVAGTFSDSVLFPGGDTQDDIVLITDAGAEGFLAKYEIDGDILWARQFGKGPAVDANKITVDPDGNVFVLGSFREFIIFEADEDNEVSLVTDSVNDLFIAKYDSDGNFLWAKQIEGTGSQSRDLVQMGAQQPLVTQPLDLSYSSFNGGELLLSGDFDGTLTLDNISLNAPVNGRSSFIASYALGSTMKLSLEIKGQEGWRFMTSPVIGETYANFLAPIWTQGVPGSNNPNASFSNIFLLDQDAFEWTSSFMLDDEIGPGNAFIVYVFSDDNNNGTPNGFPKTLESSGDWLDLDGSFQYNGLGFDPNQGHGGESHFLIANPHQLSLNFCEFVGSNVAISVDLWDPAAGGGNGDYINLHCEIDDVHIAPFQAFWVRTTDENPVLSIPEEAYLTINTDGYFKKKDNDLFHIALNIHNSDQQFSNRVNILFSEDATEGMDIFDAPKLRPEGLAKHYLSFYALDNENRGYALRSLPENFGDEIIIPLDVKTTESDKFTLTWNLPDATVYFGNYYIRDNKTGSIVNLSAETDYTFTLEEQQTVQDKLADWQPPSKLTVVNDGTPRFDLIVTRENMDGLADNSNLPDKFGLHQNYPNPFNPATIISYEVPELSQVRLDVFDITGRHIATLVNEQINSGQHQITFDASNLSSGVYMYRLQAGSTVMTRQLTLIK